MTRRSQVTETTHNRHISQQNKQSNFRFLHLHFTTSTILGWTQNCLKTQTTNSAISVVIA